MGKMEMRMILQERGRDPCCSADSGYIRAALNKLCQTFRRICKVIWENGINLIV